MRVIWKFPLEIRQHQTVNIPEGWKFLAVQEQNGKPVIWAEVNPDAPQRSWHILQLETGEKHPIADHTYLGTVQLRAPNLPGGTYVVHVFSVIY